MLLITGPGLETGMLPYLIVSQMVPTVVLAPIVLAVVHNPNVTRIIVAAYISFFAITIHRRLRWFTVPSQAVQILPLFGAAHAVSFIVRIVMGGMLPGLR